MEPVSSKYSLAPVERPSRGLPVVVPAKVVRISTRRLRGLRQLARWAASSPVARLGLATVALAAGTYLSRRMHAGRGVLPFRTRRNEVETVEWVVTGVGVSLESGGQRVSAWSIAGFARPGRPHR